MAILELLARTAGTWVIGTWHLLGYERHVIDLVSSPTGIALGSAALGLLVEVHLLLIVTLRTLLGGCLLYRLLQLGHLTTHKD